MKNKELAESAATTVVGLFASIQTTIRPQLKSFTDALEMR